MLTLDIRTDLRLVGRWPGVTRLIREARNLMWAATFEVE